MIDRVNVTTYQTVKKVPIDANKKIAMNSCGMIENKIKLNATRSMIDVTSVKKKLKLNSVKLLISSDIR